MTPKSVKGYLKLLLEIAEDTTHSLREEKKVTDDDLQLIVNIRAAIQNEFGEEASKKILVKYGLKWDG